MKKNARKTLFFIVLRLKQKMKRVEVMGPKKNEL